MEALLNILCNGSLLQFPVTDSSKMRNCYWRKMKVDGDVCGRAFTGTRLEPCVFEIEGSELGQ